MTLIAAGRYKDSLSIVVVIKQRRRYTTDRIRESIPKEPKGRMSVVVESEEDRCLLMLSVRSWQLDED